MHVTSVAEAVHVALAFTINTTVDRWIESYRRLGPHTSQAGTC